MPFTYLKQSFRSLLKNKISTSINVLGLSIGISAALVIYLIVQYDFSFDHYEPNGNRLYRLVMHTENFDTQGVPLPLPRAVEGVTGFEKTAFFMGTNDGGPTVAISQGNGKAPRIFKKQQKFVFTDGSYFSVLPHQWLAGNAATALSNPDRLVLTESLARRYFPNLPMDQILGRTVMIDDSIGTVVSGIVKDLQANTDFDHEAFISLATIPAGNLKRSFGWDDWGGTSSGDQYLILLSPGAAPAAVEREVNRMINSRYPDAVNGTVFRLQPLSDIHFNESFGASVSRPALLNLILLAVFILLLGSINFINLSTARASERAKEIGMRKILGSSRKQLIARYLSETFLLTAIAACFSLLITPLLVKLFSDFMPEGLDTSRLWQLHVLLFLLALIGVVGFLSGIYPALVLTGIKPLAVTKNQTLSTTGNNRRVWLRKALTISQFVIAQILVIGVLVVKSQLYYAMHGDRGYRQEAILNLYVPIDFAHPDGKKFVLLNKLRNIPEIQAVSLGNQAPAFSGSMSTQVSFQEGKNKNKVTLPVDSRSGDTGFISLYQIRLLAGRNVLPTDSLNEYLVNETLARKLGFQHPADAVGHMLEQEKGSGPIVGVMGDFNLASVRTLIHPAIFTYDSKYGYVMHVALYSSPDSWKKAIAKMQLAWREVYPEQPFDYHFLDKTIASFYKKDQKLSMLLSWAAGTAILISCLGLLGLVIFTANQRTKEIGIRKVLGASVTQIIALLSKDFVRLVALAFVIAVPVAWWTANQWLQNFAYHTALSWWLFAIGGVFMLVIALLILSLRAAKAALANPVKSLRTE